MVSTGIRHVPKVINSLYKACMVMIYLEDLLFLEMHVVPTTQLVALKG